MNHRIPYKKRKRVDPWWREYPYEFAGHLTVLLSLFLFIASTADLVNTPDWWHVSMSIIWTLAFFAELYALFVKHILRR